MKNHFFQINATIFEIPDQVISGKLQMSGGKLHMKRLQVGQVDVRGDVNGVIRI